MAEDLSLIPTMEPVMLVCGRTKPQSPPTKQQPSYLSVFRKLWPKDLRLNKNKTNRHRSGFLDLPPEIHIIIALFLPLSPVRWYFSPNHRLRDLCRFHGGKRVPFGTIIWKKAPHQRNKLTVGEKDVLHKTRFFCSGCGVLVGYRHFPFSELWAALHRGGDDTLLKRQC